jgi:hypothetical protein
MDLPTALVRSKRFDSADGMTSDLSSSPSRRRVREVRSLKIAQAVCAHSGNSTSGLGTVDATLINTNRQ